MSMKQYGSAVHTLEDALRNSDREDRALNREEMELEEGEAPLCMDDDDEEEEDKEGEVADKTAELETKRKQVALQRRELTKLLHLGRKKQAQAGTDAPDPSTLQPAIIQSIKLEPRKPSIREFEMTKEIGVGNFSRIVICQHRTTREEFALKIIEKKKAEQLAKRQHPNVYNEIHMERRILSERLPSEGHPRIVKLYHAIQDYGSLYMLTELHAHCGDLWSQLRSENRMVGCHPSLAKVWLSELLDSVEFLHSRGIVHRDLKPENVVLTDRGHAVLLDLGTAKDMVYTDLNGPEFVGTPDYMSPEMVKGTSGDGEVAKAKARGVVGADHTADLWAYGCILYQMCTGVLPLAAPSPYLAFLKIQRGNLYRPWGVAEDEAWDLVKSLLKVNPRERLGAECFDFSDAAMDSNGDNESKEEEKGGNSESDSAAASNSNRSTKVPTKSFGVGYDVIRQHPYFARKGPNGSTVAPEATPLSTNIYTEPHPVPSLRDLSIRAVAQLVKQDSLDLDMDKKHPPGDGSSHDMLRLNTVDRRSVMHYLDRTRIISTPRAYRRFFQTKAEARLGRLRPHTADCVGLTQLNDGMGQFPSRECTENADPRMRELAELGDPIQFVVISNPLFIKEVNENCDETTRKGYIEGLKDSIRKTNRTRPKCCVAVGYFDTQCRKLLAKVNETIPVVLCEEHRPFFTFWVCGAQGIFVRSKDFIAGASDDAASSGAGGGEDNVDEGMEVSQSAWLSEQLEQSRTAGHHAFVFSDGDPRSLPEKLVRRLARGKTLNLFGVRDANELDDAEGDYDSEYVFEGGKGGEAEDEEELEKTPKCFPANPEAEIAASTGGNVGDDDDDSVVSQDEKSHTMKISATNRSELICITLEEYGEWKSEVI
mmetsp:Transcript_19235/g.56035  ORF Transcript_19235/g.56035 Transcript_19235/m.56035 type:complete len:879 (-) Transcript_19235:91-2727(-)